MKTLPEIVKAHIDRKASLANNNEAILREAKSAEARLKLRMKSDPSLYTFVSHYADGVIGAMGIVPEPMRPMMMQELLAEIIMEWEDCNIAFENQLKPIPQ